jgi:chorismate-pyruvate lyase
MNEGPIRLLYPLDEFYARSGLAPVQVSQVEAEEVPEPYRSLLVHLNDMTPTLEAYHGEQIHLRVVARRQEGEVYSREVVLTLNGTGRPVEFGAIVIYLERFAPAAREAILEGWQPLGTIMRLHDVRHRSAPRAFVRVIADATIQEAFGLAEATSLYGRRNVLLDPEENVLAEILEILPPDGEGRQG